MIDVILLSMFLLFLSAYLTGIYLSFKEDRTLGILAVIFPIFSMSVVYEKLKDELYNKKSEL